MQNYAIFTRLFTGAILIAVWGLTDSPLLGVVFILVLTALSAIRYRFKSFRWLGVIEAIVCAGYAFLWLPALFGLWLPLTGVLESKWHEWEQELLLRDFEDRAERLKLEKERENAALELRNAARFAEISERSRIAQDIHDHVGHEITGALIALQTAAKLHDNGDKRAGELLNQTIARLESASANLRETVYNLKPIKTAGLPLLEELCDYFKFCGIEFKQSGNMSGIEHWELLAANLKEALTNVSRHSNATIVSVRLDTNADYIRMTIADNGKKAQKLRFGIGLSGMKERTRAANGTLTINTDNGFKIICVLPKGVKFETKYN
ncbi:MAG: sensor histidine kinase [Oscillospiraceae bacterium]|jgi:signal transduction histidine kinase|nr:sensor histidine kinase [Oscillospiraceae bacterium]